MYDNADYINKKKLCSALFNNTEKLINKQFEGEFLIMAKMTGIAFLLKIPVRSQAPLRHNAIELVGSQLCCMQFFSGYSSLPFRLKQTFDKFSSNFDLV